MIQPVSMLRVFIASPGDVRRERDVICEILQEWNDRHADEYCCVLQPRRWETHATPMLGARPQAILNRQLVDECDIVVGIFWAKLGTPTGEASSGTVEELERAIAQRKPVVLYFSMVPIPPQDVNVTELEQVRAFQLEVRNRGLYDSYTSIEDFRDKVSRHIHFHVRQILADRGREQAPPQIQHAATQSQPELTMKSRTVQRHLDDRGYCYRHDYELTVTLRNTTTRNLREWHIDVRFPKVLTEEVARLGDTALVRCTSDQTNRVLYPGDEQALSVPYRVDDEIFEKRAQIFPEEIIARVFADGHLVAECSDIVENMQNF